jgi:cysteine sulfinate desulfinase/cysteine desulfurase-like protein
LIYRDHHAATSLCAEAAAAMDAPRGAGCANPSCPHSAGRRARALLEDARSEVSVLTRRRDEIAAELGGLSGVIQALAVSPDELTGQTGDTSDSLSPHPPEEDEHP